MFKKNNLYRGRGISVYSYFSSKGYELRRKQKLIILISKEER